MWSPKQSKSFSNLHLFIPMKWFIVLFSQSKNKTLWRLSFSISQALLLRIISLQGKSILHLRIWSLDLIHIKSIWWLAESLNFDYECSSIDFFFFLNFFSSLSFLSFFLPCFFFLIIFFLCSFIIFIFFSILCNGTRH